MYLKKLELIGFKSFVDKTEFDFGSGMTCVVGPNGCGKSNVVDAFKWIFGEQSAKGLRGSEMKDVIFNGTDSRKPSGYGEVTAVFDNEDRFFDIDFSEVAITRRLFRSGESVYLINRQKSRLKDIKNLLMGTGIGATSYSIFEQGKIDVLLQASSLDRRIIFEEAAGISKYRARKNETLRALQRTEENLARVQDMVSELEKRRQRLRVQAGKARRYREYSERLKLHRIHLAVEDYSSSVAGRADLTYERFYHDFQISRLEGLTRRLREGLEKQAATRNEKSRALRDLREVLAATRRRRERTEESIEHNRRRVSEVGEEVSSRRRDLQNTKAGLAQTRSELERECEEQSRLAAEVCAGREGSAVILERLQGLRAEHNDLRERNEEIKRHIVDRMDEGSRLNNALVQLESELGNLEGRGARLESQVTGARLELGEIEAKVTTVSRDLEVARGKIEGVEQRRDAAAAELARLEARVSELSRTAAAVQGEIRSARSRLDVLQTFEENLDGVAQGVASILRECREEGATGVHGLLAHLVEVDSAHAPAVEAALGIRSQALIVDSHQLAVSLLHRAREARAGAVELIALDRVEPHVADEIPAGQDVLGRLRDHVTILQSQGSALHDLVEFLLGRVVLVNDLETALALSRNGLRSFRLVTLAGELLEPPGSFSIGGNSTTGLISRRSEMQDLEGKLRELQEEAGALEGSLNEAAVARDVSETEVTELARTRESVALRLASLQSDAGQLEKDRERLRRVTEVAESELGDVLADVDTHRTESGAFQSKLEDANLQRKILESEAADLETRVHGHGEEVHAAAEALTEARVALAEAEKREEGLCKAIRKLEEAVSEREDRHRALETEIARLQERLKRTSEDLQRGEVTLEEICGDEVDQAERVGEAEAEDEKLGDIEGAFRAEIDRLHAEIAEFNSARAEINLRDQEGVLRRNQILENVSREYDLDLLELMDRAMRGSDASASAAASELAAVSESEAAVAGDASEEPERLPSLEELMGQWMSGDDEDWDHDAAAEEARMLQEKIHRIGNVNLEALEELEELEERVGFHIAQRDDLLKAERDLRQIISEINRTSRELFSKTFTEVQKNFSDIFQKCFGGGKAELVLEDGADILEAGIEIIARPPGKKLTSLTLMSGGEKTMTTIALLFAIFKARPSPFCILDEVDAPLDENNVGRFVVMLQEFLISSQFIIITHNKITMAVADVLYGVTMQERGVSKRVAVQFETYDPENPHQSLSTSDLDAAPVREGARA